MSTAALQRTVRRCTALLLAVLWIGFDGLSPGFDGTTLVAAGLLYLLVSGLYGIFRIRDETIDGGDTGPADGAGGESDPSR